MKLPKQYEWLEGLEGKPRMIETALSFFGTNEKKGRGSNPRILEWVEKLNNAGAKIESYADDDTPWCGLFVAICAYLRKSDAAEVVKDPLWAANWEGYGQEVTTAVLGDILVFKRPGGNHVAFYVGEDEMCYHVLGGNQSDQVSITRIAKSRCWSIRRPLYNNMPASAKAYKLNPIGLPSKNEQ